MTTVTKPERTRETAAPTESFLGPAVDIHETKEAYVLEADMPGVGKDGLEVVLEGNELTITGRRPGQRDGEVLHRESVSGDYRRTFVLDPVIDTAKIQARMDDGVLRLVLPKAEAVLPRRIAVTD